MEETTTRTPRTIPTELPGALWERLKADPQYAPEHVALEAVRRLGPEARQWADALRADEEQLTGGAAARLAIGRFTNLARLSGAVSGAAGLPAAVLDTGFLAWTQCRMVLHVAAAHGADPGHPDRAVDLLVLQGIHPVAEAARLALGVAAGRERAGNLFTDPRPRLSNSELLRLGVKLARMAGLGAARRVVAKIIPGASIVLGTWVNSRATTDLARRAVRMYGPPALPGG